MLETQNTTYDGDTISGEMVIRFDKVRLDDFLSYRMRIRQITGLGNIHLHHTSIEEQALVQKIALMKPPTPPTPPDAKVVEEKPRGKRKPYVTFQYKQFFKGMAGTAYADMIKKFNEKFKKKHLTDGEIIQMFQRVQGIQ